MYEQVRAVESNNEWIQPCSQHYLWCEQFIVCNTKIFFEIIFWTQIRNKNSTTREPKANLIAMKNIAVHQGNKCWMEKCTFALVNLFFMGFYSQVHFPLWLAFVNYRQCVFHKYFLFYSNRNWASFFLSRKICYMLSSMHSSWSLLFCVFLLLLKCNRSTKAGPKWKERKKGMRRSWTTPHCFLFWP